MTAHQARKQYVYSKNCVQNFANTHEITGNPTHLENLILNTNFFDLFWLKRFLYAKCL